MSRLIRAPRSTSRSSSPVLKARRKTAKARACRSGWRIIVLFTCAFLLWYLLPPVTVRDSLEPRRFDIEMDIPSMVHVSRLAGHPVVEQLSPVEMPPLPPVFLNRTTFYASPRGSSGTTVILPITTSSGSVLDDNLRALLDYGRDLSEIVLVSPRSLHKEVRKTLHAMVSSEEQIARTDLTLLSWLPDTNEDLVILRAARQATTDHVLLLSSSGLQSLDNDTRELIFSARYSTVDLPVGPRGFSFSSRDLTCLSPTELAQPALYLVPPIVMPSFLVPDVDLIPDIEHGIWFSLGDRISRKRNDMTGGIVIGSPTASFDWCPSFQSQESRQVAPDILDTFPLETIQLTHDVHATFHPPSNVFPNSHPSGLGGFLLIFSSPQNLKAYSPAACGLLRQGYRVQALVYSDENLDMRDHRTLTHGDCALEYSIDHWPESGFKDEAAISDWLVTFGPVLDVIIASSDDKLFSFHIDLLVNYGHSHDTPTVVHVPRADLAYCEWMGTLSLQEWRNWHVPEVDISVITNDRPWSLQRLLTSLSSARYFGDSLDVRINLEQTADPETMELVGDFDWEHGRVFIHHRIVHGGLLPAVVESWYPHSNHSYGLILEDDVELSPLFYAWIKMSLLRYRYSTSENASPQLFGISLYQQKHLELRPEGRHPFNARSTFAAAGLSEPTSPYLSQIPCSWGAVYFPEHWREFHTYLSFRLSEYAWDIDESVVPAVRSNNWTRSWKKYFIELVYLRGYVMLYPNYKDYVSLSTNHLEAGSHVKDVPSDTYLRKKRLFLLPLMQLPNAGDTLPLLDFPDGTLPQWLALPVLDLLGLLATHESLVQRGLHRRHEMTGCVDSSVMMYDASHLLCLQNSVSKQLAT